MCIRDRISSDKLRKGALDKAEWEKLVSMTGKLSESPIFIDDTPALSVFDLRSKCRRLKAMHNIDLIIVDYLQLMRAEVDTCLLYTSPSPRDRTRYRMPSSA